ncbi:MAG: hypothetical protein WC256_09725 [Desulfurivibrionaceae bacterium]|jgi:DNA-binding response OmpR family regulator
MSAGIQREWRFLVVEDQEVIAQQVIEAIPGFVAAPDTAVGCKCGTFGEAMKLLGNERFDLLILDLKDDNNQAITDDDDASAGMMIFEELKKTRFSPVIFYTAHAHKVRSLETSFVRIVEKTEGLSKLGEEVGNILATQLPAISRRIEEIQRTYMWDFVGQHWQDYDSHPQHKQADLAYLMARRLAVSLQNEAKTLAYKVAADTAPSADSASIHPMEMYVHPPVSGSHFAGDIVRGDVGGENGVWLVLTPSCDFERRHPLDNVLLARCLPLTGLQEFTAWKDDPTASKEGPLKALIGDSRQKAQSERFKFLPGTFFLPDSVVDFQRLATITFTGLALLEVVASLDSPFAEAILARFARYFGRLGTPDIDRDLVLRRLVATPPESPIAGTS